MRFLLLIIFTHCIFAVEIQAQLPQLEGNRPERQAHELFRRIDQNRDQLITPDESPKWLMRRFARVDLDKDRAIDFPEFFYLFQRQKKEGQGSGNEIEPPVSENPGRPTVTQPVTEESEHECEQNPRIPVPVI